MICIQKAYYRSRKITLGIPEKWDQANELIPEGFNLSLEQHSKLKAYLLKITNGLPPKYRKVIQLSELDGVFQKDIAQELGLNYATVRSRIQRGRNKLKKIIPNCCEVSKRC